MIFFFLLKGSLILRIIFFDNAIVLFMTIHMTSCKIKVILLIKYCISHYNKIFVNVIISTYNHTKY